MSREEREGDSGGLGAFWDGENVDKDFVLGRRVWGSI